jgi:hypothetical protein
VAKVEAHRRTGNASGDIENLPAQKHENEGPVGNGEESVGATTVQPMKFSANLIVQR